MTFDTSRIARRIGAALGKTTPDLVLRNGRVVNVFTGEVERRSIAVHGGVIVGLHDGSAADEVDLDGLFVLPGLIDGHIHLESTHLTPAELARAVVPRGTSAVVADPHEIANVMGVAGIRALLQSSKGLPLDVYLMAPSCVPATALQPSGAIVTPRDLTELAEHPRVLGLGEVMDHRALFELKPSLLEKLARFHGRPIDGHGAGLAQRELDAYVVAGAQSDHECETLEEGLARLERGMWLMIREGSTAHNMAALSPLVNPVTERRCMLVTDDRLPDSLAREGHLDELLRRAVRQGLDPVTAIRMVTLNPSERFGLANRGAVAPGRRADLVVVGDLDRFDVRAVYHAGTRVAVGGRLACRVERTFPDSARGRVRVAPLDEATFECRVQGPYTRYIEVRPGRLSTRSGLETTPDCDGRLAADPLRDLARVVVIDRHSAKDAAGYGLLRGLGMHDGALATTFAHDAHPLAVVGIDRRSMLAAAQWVASHDGGLAVARDGHVIAGLPLPLAGLLSDKPLGVVLEQLDAVNQAARMVCEHPEPFTALSFVSLEVVPELRLTVNGLVDVAAGALIPLFVS